MGACRPDPHPALACHAAHVAAQLAQFAHHVGGRVAYGGGDLEHGLHQLRVDLLLELVTLDRREHGLDVLHEVERLSVEQLVLLLDAQRVRRALAERVVEHAGARAHPERALAGDVGRNQLLRHPSTASASISTFHEGSSSAHTTHVAAGRMSRNTSPCARATSLQYDRSVM